MRDGSVNQIDIIALMLIVACRITIQNIFVRRDGYLAYTTAPLCGKEGDDASFAPNLSGRLSD
jgi:hypothetical protein